MQNALKSNEWQWIWVLKTCKMEIEKGGPNNSDFLQNWFHSETRSSSLISRNFKALRKVLLNSRMHWNLMKDDQFGSLKLLKLKYRRGHQIIQTFCKIGSPQKLCPLSIICRNLETLRKVLLNHSECIEIWWMTMNLGLENF